MSEPAAEARIRELFGQSLARIQVLEEQLTRAQSARHEPVAVIGLGSRLPGGATPARFWDLLASGGDAVTEIPPSRRNGADAAGPGYASRWAGLIEQVDRLDEAFMGISPREAAQLDPQQRLVLEVAWEALEDAALAPARLAGTRTGVFIGISWQDYLRNVTAGGPGSTNAYTLTGNMLSIAAGRVAYLLGLHGPAIALDTACSSSLVAVHLACRSLRDRESDVALAGGVNLLLSELTTEALGKVQALSPDGRCRTFDAAANGYVRGEGAGIIVLKRLSDARRDGDEVYAVLRGSAVNHDGHSMGLTAPNPVAQSSLLRDALADAGLSPADIGYIEAHGTGTVLGDPIEVEALAEVFGAPRADGSSLLLGSVKTNIGHLEAAAGIAGLIKAVLALKHEHIPQHLHLRTLNPEIRLDGTPLVIAAGGSRWPRGDTPRRAGVSSFGFAGTNAHVIVEEAPAAAPSAVPAPPPVHLLPLSARSGEGLAELCRRYAQRLTPGGEDLPLGDVCRTAGEGRNHFEYRLAILADSPATARRLLSAAAAGEQPEGVLRSPGEVTEAPRLGLIFPGQGVPEPAKASRLLHAYPRLRETLLRCAELLGPSAGEWLRSVAGSADGAAGLPAHAGPQYLAAFAWEWAVCELWRSWGLRAEVVGGTGAGELVAACAAEALSLEDGLRLAADFGRLGPAPAADAFEAAAAGAGMRPPRISWVSGVTTEVIGDAQSGAGYWRGQAAAPAGYSELTRAIERAGATAVLSTGSEPLRGLGELYALGADIAWAAVSGDYGRRRSGLPTYPFQGHRHWVEAPAARPPARAAEIAAPAPGDGDGSAGRWPILGARVPGEGHRASDTVDLSPQAPAYLTDHRVFGEVVVPAAWFAAAALAVADELSGAGDNPAPEYLAIEDVAISRPLVVTEPAQVRLELGPGDGPRQLRVAHRDSASGSWIEHSRATLPGQPGGHVAGDLPVAELRARLGAALNPGQGSGPGAAADFYDSAAALSLRFGPAFRWIEELTGGGDEVLARLRRPVGLTDDAPLPPALLDAVFQTLAALGAVATEVPYLPVRVARVSVVRAPRLADGAVLWCHSRVTLRTEDRIVGDMVLATADGRVLAAVDGMCLLRAEPAAFRRALEVTPSPAAAACRSLRYEVAWRPGDEPPRPAAAGRWLVLGAGALAAGLSAGLRAQGAEVIEARPGTRLARLGEAAFEVDAADQASLAALLATVRPLTAVVNALAADARPADSAAGLEAAAPGVLGTALHLAQAVVGGDSPVPPCWLVTRGAQRVSEADGADPAQALLWGFGRTLMLEHPEADCRLLDLDPRSPDPEGAAAQLLAADAERQVAIRAGVRHVARLVHGPAATPAASRLTVPAGASYQLAIPPSGELGNLRLATAERRAPGDGEVEIAVEMTGLNFRDVLTALGLYPPDELPFGHECAGRVSAVGPGVTAVRVGDPVLALAAGSFTRFVTADQRLVVPLPPGISFAEAATVPVTFATAWYGLFDLGRMTAGSKVLIHAAAGGVGMAAVQLALWAGAEVYATASPGKWSAVRALGVKHVWNSRTLDFADGVRDAAGAHGVDIVLNSLTGEANDRSLALLADDGRFIEMGNTDLRAPQTIAATRPGVVYRPFDVYEADTGRLGEILREVVAMLGRGQLRPLPCEVFPVTEAVQAFRRMAAARHIGKIVLRMSGRRPIDPDGAYLITGGLGDLGLAVAGWLAERGAGHLVLAGRRPPADEARAAIEELRASGADVVVRQADVSRREDVAALIAGLPTLRGVVHCAGFLDDGMLQHQTWERFAGVLAPKALGAMHLHELTRDRRLDLFVEFSSTTAVFGSAGQANYAAANAALDALAHQRRATGEAALSINWGPFADVGMAARVSRRATRMAGIGFGGLTVSSGYAVLEELLAGDDAQAAVVDLDVTRWRAAFPAAAADPVASELTAGELVTSELDAGERGAGGQDGGQFGQSTSPAAPAALRAPVTAPAPVASSVLLSALAAAQRREWPALIAQAVAKRAGQVLGITGDVNRRRALRDQGLDSLTAVELRNALAADIGKPLPPTLAFDYPTIERISAHLAEIATVDEGAAQPAPGASAAAPLPAVTEVQAVAPAPAVTERPPAAPAGPEPIAIIGMGCRFPGGVTTPEELWELLVAGTDAVTEVPAERYDVNAYYDSDPDAVGKLYTRWGGFVAGIDRFDAGFFGIAPIEARMMDPQQRMLLEVSWEALERAGKSPAGLAGSATGVFVGIATSEYAARALHQDASRIDAYSATGNLPSVASGRLSYVLGLRGPSVSVDSACSSSLTALHLACQSLRSGESELALAGGANALVSPDLTIGFCRNRSLSPSGRCKSFAADADGFVQGEGAGMLVLQRLSDAVRDGAEVLAVIRGSAVNNDGDSNGLTAPSGPAQTAVIRQALASAGLEPDQVGYVEAHGTGTRLGDVIEVRALAEAMGARPREHPLLLGSVKSNIGHLEAAAGVAGVIKVVLALRHRQVPASLHAATLNPHLPWAELPVEVVTALRDWPGRVPVAGPAGTAERRIGGVSSFGISGTNAHVLVEEAPEPPRAAPGPAASRPAHLLVLSARGQGGLTAIAERWAGWLEAGPRAALGDICHTAAVARGHFEDRLAVVASSLTQAAAGLRAVAAGEPTALGGRGHVKGTAGRRVALLFTGPGAQYHGMGRQLFDTQPVFRAALERCDEIAGPITGRTRLLAALYGDDGGGLLDQPAFAQPAQFAIDWALWQLWRSWGVQPAAVLGDGVGEYVAACAAGALAVEDALPLAVTWGRLTQNTRRDEQATEPMLDALAAAAAAVPVKAPEIPLVSSVTGAEAGPDWGSPAYWRQHAGSTVRLARAMTTLGALDIDACLEIGPHPTLTGQVTPAPLVTSLDRHRPDWEAMLHSAGRLYTAGVEMDLTAMDDPHDFRRVDAPTYPFQRQRHWIELEAGRPAAAAVPPAPLGPAPSPVAAPASLVAAPASAAASPVHRIAWREQPPSVGRPDPGGRWLVLAEPGALAAGLLERMRAAGADCLHVTPGTGFAVTGDGTARCDPSSPAAVVAMLMAARASHPLRGVLYIADPRDTPAGPAPHEVAEELLAGALTVAQALAAAGGPPLWLVTRGGQQVTTDDRIQLAVAPLWGFARTAQLEHPEIGCRIADLGTGTADELDGLIAELCDERAARQVALRGRRRLLPVLEPAFAELTAGSGSVSLLRTDGTVLITGGLGGLGIHTASWLAASGVRDLVLVGRSAPGPAAAAAIGELTARGIRVVARQADVADRPALAAVIDETARTMPPLRGVLHLACVLDDGVLRAQTRARFATVLGPKMAGSWHLHELTAALPLDFFVLFSSLSGLVGVPGQAAYSAGNAFLDALAALRRDQGLPGLSLGWGPWSGDGRAAQASARDAALLRSRGYAAMTPADALTVMTQAIGSRMGGQLAVVPLDLSAVARVPSAQLPAVLAPLLASAPAVSAQPPLLPPSPLPASAPAPVSPAPDPVRQVPPASSAAVGRADIKARVERVLRKTLGMGPGPSTELEVPLGLLGMDSLNAVDFSRALTAEFGRQMPAQLAFDQPTVEAVTDYIRGVLATPSGPVVPEPLPVAAVAAVAATEAVAAVAAVVPVPGQEAPVPRVSVLPAPVPPASVPPAPVSPVPAPALPVPPSPPAVPAAVATRPTGENAQPGRERDGTAPFDIAIVGVSGRYPGAHDLDEFWTVLADGRDCVTEIPAGRWDLAGFYDPDPARSGTSYSKWGGFLDQVDAFDPLFFSISPREAELMDPQERLFLETSHAALEDAGYTVAGLAKAGIRPEDTGVFAGVMWSGYELYGGDPARFGRGPLPSSSYWSVANRVSYFLNFQGPSMAVDTACSSSLTAIHLACESLRSGDCRIAVAGGVNVSVHPQKYLLLSQTRFASTDGRCRSFGAGGDGMVPGEGVGAVVLRPLADAERDGDHIHAVIKGTAVNHGGRAARYTAPTTAGQAAVIRKALRRSGVDAATIGYVEAHGTGTALGDPIEVAGLAEALGESPRPAGSVPIGSLKSNIGHLEAASGVAGLTKLLLQLRHGRIAPTLHSDPANPHIDFAATPFRLPREAEDWPLPAPRHDARPAPRRAALSSFGAGGSNAHLILEEYTDPRAAVPSDGEEIVVLSAKEPQRLREYAERLAGFSRQPGAALPDLAYTLQAGREPQRERLALVVRDLDELGLKLAAWLAGTGTDRVYAGTAGSGADRLREAEAEDQAYVQALAEAGKYHRIASLWAAGSEIDWERISPRDGRRRISMPTYPFARERYWLPGSEPLAGEPASAGVPEARSTPAAIAPDAGAAPPARFALARSWQAAPASTGPVTVVTDLSARRIAVLIDARAASALKSALAAVVGDARLLVELEPSASDLADQEAGSALASRLAALAGGLEGVIDLCDLGRAVDDGAVDYRRIGFYQSVIADRGERPVLLLHVSEGLLSGTRLAGAPLAGLAAAIGAEHSGVTARSIDAGAGAADPVRLLEVLRQEAARPATAGEREARHGAAGREVPVLRPVELRPGLVIRPDSSYVISGGTRGLGAEFARMLADRGVRRLALLGAQPLPPRSRWQEVAASGTPDGDKVGRLLTLTERGVDLLLYTGSLLDADALGRFFDEVRSRLGPIGGVLHCAGLASDESPAFVHKTAAGMARVLEPKIEGTRTLAGVLDGDRPDFFVLFSSVTAAVPRLAVGMSDYAMGNAYLDRFAEFQHSRGRTWFRSVNWPSFSSADLGAAGGAAYRATGLPVLDPADGLELLDGLLGAGQPVLLPAETVPAETVPEEAVPALAVPENDEEAEEAEDEVTVDGGVTEDHDAAMPVPPVPVREAAYRALVEVFSGELKLAPERLRGDVPFDDYGVDSVLLASAVRKIEEIVGEPFEPALLFDYPTLDSLSGVLAERYPRGFAAPGPNGTAPDETTPPSAVITAARAPRRPPATAVATVAEPAAATTAIAVIGIGCQFPGAPDKERFWDLLNRAECAVREVPPQRWDPRLRYAPTHAPGRTTGKWGGFVDDIDLFDPGYFGIGEEEALQVDPLQRLMLQTALAATLDAGYSRAELSGLRAGVYAGTRSANYASRIEEPGKSTIVGTGQNFIAARISDFFDWHGAAMVVDTACSSSLVSVHLACQALRSREIDLAIAGGADLLLDETPYLILSAIGALSPDGRCHTFDENANGFVPGEGAGAVLLKRLDQALADGDQIRAVIRGSAVGNDGHTMGITTPNLDAQVEVVEAALAAAGVRAADISYVEAHGTGTMLGDPIELKALERVFRKATDERGFCAVGSVKTNIGHLLSAAGIAGLVKTALALERETLPATLHCDRPNPRFAFGQSPFRVQQETRPWPSTAGRPRRAGISAFGFGGTNCHLILEEAVAAPVPRRAPLPPPAFNRRSYLLARRPPATLSPDLGAPPAARAPGGPPHFELEPIFADAGSAFIPPTSSEMPIFELEPLS